MARYYRWTSLNRRAASVTGFQASEFQMLVGGVRQVATSVNGETSGASENAFRLNDNSTATKHFQSSLDFGVSYTMTFDYGSSIAADQYRWYTANDSPDRDVVSWIVESSNDAVAWTVIDARFGYAVTTSRTSLVGTFTFNNPTVPTPPYITYVRWTVTKRRSSTSLIQADDFGISAGGTWIPASFVSEINGTGNQDAEDVISLNDNSSSTKWVGSTASQTETRQVVFEYGYSNPVPDAYFWRTGNDDSTRDPVSWTVHTSQDGVTWTLIDTRTDYAVTTSRDTVVGPFSIGGSPTVSRTSRRRQPALTFRGR